MSVEMSVEKEVEQVQTTTVQPKAVKEPAGTHTKTTLFVRKVPFDATTAEFEAFFSTYGPLRSCFLIKDEGKKEGGEQEVKEGEAAKPLHKGFGFVHFADASDATTALEALSKTKFKDRKLKAEFALRKNVKQDSVPKAPVAVKKVFQPKDPKPAKPRESPFLQVIFENCPKLPDRKQIYKRARKAGEVKDITMTEPNSILLSFPDSTEAEKAKSKLDGHIFKGFKMVVTQPEVSIKGHRLIVRNLSFKATVDALVAVFEKFGPLALDRVLIGQKNGKSAGFAFVQFMNKADAEKAMESVTNTEVCGRTVAVDWALPKKTYDSIVAGAQVDTQAEPNLEIAEEEQPEVKEVEVAESESESDDSETESKEEKAADSLESTVFIRNLSFDTEEEDLSAALSRFGKVVSCKIVKNPTTGLGKGTAFVQFAAVESAKKALNAKPADVTSTPAVKAATSTSTLVDPDAFIPNDTSSAPILNNRQLIILPAVDKKSATRLKDVSTESFDRRHLSLIKESSLMKFQKAYPKKAIDEREKDIKDRLRSLKRDQNLFISDTRLSLRHLPPTVDEKTLKAFIKNSLSDSAAPKTRIPQVKIVRDANDRKNRSKGFGFVQLDEAKAALHLVRWLISDPSRWAKLGVRGADNYPIIEYATEKQTVVNSRQKRLADNHPAMKPNMKRKSEAVEEPKNGGKRMRTAMPTGSSKPTGKKFEKPAIASKPTGKRFEKPTMNGKKFEKSASKPNGPKFEKSAKPMASGKKVEKPTKPMAAKTNGTKFGKPMRK